MKDVWYIKCLCVHVLMVWVKTSCIMGLRWYVRRTLFEFTCQSLSYTLTAGAKTKQNVDWRCARAFNGLSLTWLSFSLSCLHVFSFFPTCSDRTATPEETTQLTTAGRPTTMPARQRGRKNTADTGNNDRDRHRIVAVHVNRRQGYAPRRRCAHDAQYFL